MGGAYRILLDILMKGKFKLSFSYQQSEYIFARTWNEEITTLLKVLWSWSGNGRGILLLGPMDAGTITSAMAILILYQEMKSWKTSKQVN